jgi:hypothetical protein
MRSARPPLPRNRLSVRHHRRARSSTAKVASTSDERAGQNHERERLVAIAIDDLRHDLRGVVRRRRSPDEIARTGLKNSAVAHGRGHFMGLLDPHRPAADESSERCITAELVPRAMYSRRQHRSSSGAEVQDRRCASKFSDVAAGAASWCRTSRSACRVYVVAHDARADWRSILDLVRLA